MALLKLSGMATAISGKLGGSILGTAPSGSYIKQNSYSQQHETISQSLQRTKIGLVSQEWRSATPTQQQGWIDEAVNYPYTNRVGDTAYYTGFQLFCLLNWGLFGQGASINLTVPTQTALTTVTVGYQSTTATFFRYTYSNNTDSAAFFIYIAPPQSGNYVPKLSEYRLVWVETGVGVSGSDGITNTEWSGVPYPEIGDKIYYYVKAVNKTSGRISDTTDVIVGVRVS